MSNLLIVFGLVVLAKFVINLFRYIACNWYSSKYVSYLMNPSWSFDELQPQIVRLFKEADIQDNVVAYVEPVGYGHVLTSANMSVMLNLTNRREDVVQSVTAMFHLARGVFRSRMWDAINPIYWVLFIMYLPKNLFQYVGAKPESAIVRFAQVIYWFLSIIGTVLISVFPNEINAYIKSVLGIP